MKLNDKQLLEKLKIKYGKGIILNEIANIDIVPEKVITDLRNEIYKIISEGNYKLYADRKHKTNFGYAEHLYGNINKEIEIEYNNIVYLFFVDFDINVKEEYETGDYYQPPYSESTAQISNMSIYYNISDSNDFLFDDDKELDQLYIRQIEQRLKNIKF